MRHRGLGQPHLVFRQRERPAAASIRACAAHAARYTATSCRISAPERNQRTPWKTFLQAHWEGRAAADLFTVEGLTLGRSSAVVRLLRNRVEDPPGDIAGDPPAARRPVDGADGPHSDLSGRRLPADRRQLMHDRDPLYTRGCGEILTSGDVGPIRLPPKSPKLNADAER